MKHFADNNRREVSFQECDWVMVKLRPYRQSSVIGPNPTKLSKRYYGLFKVLDRIRTVAYKLLLPEGSHIHPIFHCSLLKPFLHDAANEPRPLLLLGKDMENHPVITPLAILVGRAPRRHFAYKWLFNGQVSMLVTHYGKIGPLWRKIINLRTRWFSMGSLVIDQAGCKKPRTRGPRGRLLHLNVSTSMSSCS